MVNVYPSQLVTDQAQTFHGNKDFQALITRIGDPLSTGNDTLLTVDDTGKTIHMNAVDTGIVSEVRVDTSQVSFIYSNGTHTSQLLGSGGQSAITSINIGTGNTGSIDIRPASASLYNQDGGTSDIWGTEATNGVVKIGNYDLSNNSTLLTVNDTAKTITFAADGYSPTSADIPITVKVSLSSAEILALNSTPKQLVADPGAGKMIVPLHVWCQYTFNTAAYATNTILGIFYDTLSANYMGGSNVINQTSDSASPLTIIGGANHSMLANKALKIKTDTGDPTAGAGTVDVYVTYKIVSL